LSEGFDDIQLIPKEKWNFPADFAIYDNTVTYMLHKELMAIVIEAEALADGMKKIFDLAFEEAKRLNIVGEDIKQSRKKKLRFNSSQKRARGTRR
jgi:hypothetical protein